MQRFTQRGCSTDILKFNIVSRYRTGLPSVLDYSSLVATKLFAPSEHSELLSRQMVLETRCLNLMSYLSYSHTYKHTDHDDSHLIPPPWVSFSFPCRVTYTSSSIINLPTGHLNHLTQDINHLTQDKSSQNGRKKERGLARQ